MSNSYRTLSQHLNDLKKENFSLKLRIYFLEERIQQKYENNSDDVYRTNIELKVEVESLKQELQEKQQLLDKALITAESLTNHNEAELQRHCEARQEEIDHMQQVLQTKIQLLQEEAQLARSEAERMASLAESSCSQHPPVTMEPITKEISVAKFSQPPNLLPDSRDSKRIEELTAAVRCKEILILELTEERSSLRERVAEMEEQLQELSASLLQKERDAEFYQEELGRERLRVQQEMQSLVEEQQSQLNQYESAAGKCVNELQKAQLQVQSLQTQIQESETSNKNLQGKLSEMQTELRSIRQEAQNQDRTIQSLTESLSTKETETQELYQVIEGQNTTLCKLREVAHRNQLQHSQDIEGADLHGELVALQSSIFGCQLELEASQRAERRSHRVAEDLVRSRDRLHSDLEAALEHRETTEKYNQALRSTVQQLRSELQVKEAQLKESEADKHAEVLARDKAISELQISLREKDRIVKEYSELLEQHAEPGRARDALLQKLKCRIRDRDKALERSIDEKFRCLEEKETEVRKLQLALREKERDLERLRCILTNNEETITSVDALMRSKELELEQTQETCRKMQWLKQQSDEKHTVALHERDNIIAQLHTTLHTRSKETEDLTAALLAKLAPSPNEVVEELKSRLALKERLFQEVLSERSRQTQEHHTLIQDLLNTISSRDQYIKESGARLRQVITERTGQLQEMRRHLSSREQELSEVTRQREAERERRAPLAMEMERLQNKLREKESLIQDLMQNQEEAQATSRSSTILKPGDSGSELEMQAVKEELQIALRKHKETEREIMELRSALTKKPENCTITDPQSALEQLVSEYQQLNQALIAEKRLYQNLNQRQCAGDSVEKTQVLHVELDTVQALRGQLEEVLIRTRDTALALDRAAKAHADYGEFSTDEDEDEIDDDDDEDEEDDDEGSSSEEFTDSIEDDVKLTSESLANTEQNAGGSGVPVSRRISQEVMRGGWEEKKKEERATGEEKNQLSQSDCTSLSQDRSTVPNLQEELSGSGSGSGQDSGCGPGAESNVSVKCRRWEQSETDRLNPHGQQRTHMLIEEEEDESDDDEAEEEEDMRAPGGKRGLPDVTLRDGAGKRRCNRPHSLDLGVLLTQKAAGESRAQEKEGESGGSAGFWQHVEAGLREQAERLRSDLALSRQESRELQERLMVSEATVHAQADQLKEYRELLTESVVQQDSKQVQVDLQDLGYETSGRSENEAEREDTSSPDFDDVEMCNTVSQLSYGSVGNSWEQHGNSSQPEDLLIQNLRAQLSRCHKVIRGLQVRVRSLSATSDYASSLERTPRKVNWAFQDSPAHSGLEEDEGWHSDGPALGTPKSNRELQELVSRVALLENQIRSGKLEEKRGTEEGKSATWPGKYNTLIQAQARELSHLRQRMREGRGICHILTQHLGDTTKAFEELLRANDIDYYMGQSFREQLSQSSSLTQRISIKLNGRDRSEVQDDKMGHELLALRLSKELQQKDKIIESLHTKLQQRPDTPSSSHAPSETTDQSDRTSFVSDERASINEDLELCSDVDAVSEYAQDEPTHRANDEDCTSFHPVPPSIQSNTTPYSPKQSNTGVYSAPLYGSLPLAQTHPWSNSSNNLKSDPMHFFGPLTAEQHQKGLRRPPVRSFSLPHSLSSYPLMGSTLPAPSHFSQLSHHSLHQPPKSDSSLVGSSALWDMDNMVQPNISFTGAPGYQSGNHSGVDLIEEHLLEIRTLRQRLEDSIRTNERLRQQLETRLANAARDGGPTAAPTNIYIQGLDTVTQLSNEIRILKEENLSLQSRLQTSKDNSEEVEQLREVVLSGRARLKQAELEAEQWKEELRRLQTHSCEQSQQIQQLRQERQNNQEHNNRLQHEASLLHQQLTESRQLLHSLQCELQLYDRVCAGSKGAPTGELNQLLLEVRALRAQLERSIQENSALRIQLQKQVEQQLSTAGLEPRPSSLIPASPMRDTLYKRQLLHDSLEPHADLEGDAPDGSYANRNGRHAIGHVDDFSALQQQVMEGTGLVQRMEAMLNTCLNTALMEVSSGKTLDYASVKTLLGNTKTLRQILEEAVSLLKMFWRAALPNSEGPAQYLQKEQLMKEEIQSLRMRIAEQEEVLQKTIQRLRSTSRTKESMETFIVSQLSRTRDVLKKARTNLEKNELRISILSSSSSSLYHGTVLKGACPGSSDRGGVTPEIATDSSSMRLAKKRAWECLH